MPSIKIEANAVTLLDLLDKKKFTIGYFQREYRWEERHIVQLVDDLTGNFLNDYAPEHDRKEVANYNTYYMGPIVLTDEGAQLSVIDGQQRLTSLTLLLIYLHNRQKDDPQSKGIESVETLIYSEKFGQKSYNMQVPEREACLGALFAEGTYSLDGEKDESVKNLVARYEDISGKEHFPDEIDCHALPYFTSWVKEKLVFVMIVAGDEEKAYTIFETMNDRGLRLSETDMLKSYLLSKIKDTGKRDQLNTRWKAAITKLRAEYEWHNKEEDLEFFRAWFRAKYAETIRQARKGAVNEDFEKIGTAFHTWLKNRESLAGLASDKTFLPFVEKTFPFYCGLYQSILDAYAKETRALPRLYATAWFGVAPSLALPLLMSPISPADPPEARNKKLELVAHFLDCFTVYRSVNHRTLGQSSIRYTMYSLVKEVRNTTVKQLATTLKRQVQAFEDGLNGIQSFTLNQRNKKFVHYFLARLTTHIEQACGVASHLDQYMDKEVKDPFEIEHLWADAYDRHTDEFDQIVDFQAHRNMLGGLVLLPKSINQSLLDESYKKKLRHYVEENLLSRPLHEDCYKKRPKFTRWVKGTGLPFKPHKQFKKADLYARTALYQAIAEQIWSPDQFDKIANS